MISNDKVKNLNFISSKFMNCKYNKRFVILVIMTLIYLYKNMLKWRIPKKYFINFAEINRI